MGKIKDFSITTSGENLTYLAGSTVEGKVIIDLKRPKATDGPLRIILSGQAKVQWRTGFVNTLYSMTYQYSCGAQDPKL